MTIDTHVVENQAVRQPDFDAYRTDAALVDTMERYGASWAAGALSGLGAVAGSQHGEDLARLANEKKPDLVLFDRFGNRVDEVEFHPAYHELMTLGKTHAVHSFDWSNAGKTGAGVARAGLHYLYGQVEAGVCCPMTMTHAVVPSLRTSPELAAEWESRVLANAYDPRLVDPAIKRGVTFGMAMTEKQGGSDVRANTTRAEPTADGGFVLTGHKWFCSAPMSDGFLTLAQEDAGLSCFLVRRILPDGTRNRFFIQRLKDKLGNRSNASSEIEYRGTWAQRVGAPGKGVRTIIEMVGQTRLDVAVGAAGGMRQAVRYAVHHARCRRAFGKRLIEQPLMRNVLADLSVETEAAVALSFRLAAAFERSADPAEATLARVAMPIAKYWCAKRVIDVTAEALECHGGNGYVEDFPLARMYREAPLGSIWEGSGNVQCLDVLRVMHRTPGALDVLVQQLTRHVGADARYDRWIRDLQGMLGDTEQLEFRARTLVERLAIALQASLLLDGEPVVAEAFLASRLGAGRLFGNLPVGVDTEALIHRGIA